MSWNTVAIYLSSDILKYNIHQYGVGHQLMQSFTLRMRSSQFFWDQSLSLSIASEDKTHLLCINESMMHSPDQVTRLVRLVHTGFSKQGLL